MNARTRRFAARLSGSADRREVSRLGGLLDVLVGDAASFFAEPEDEMELGVTLALAGSDRKLRRFGVAFDGHLAGLGERGCSPAVRARCLLALMADCLEEATPA